MKESNQSSPTANFERVLSQLLSLRKEEEENKGMFDDVLKELLFQREENARFRGRKTHGYRPSNGQQRKSTTRENNNRKRLKLSEPQHNSITSNNNKRPKLSEPQHNSREPQHNCVTTTLLIDFLFSKSRCSNSSSNISPVL